MKGISIITCSINSDLFNSFEANVNSTIGDVSYEIIRVDNNKLKLSITKAYNFGASKAKFDKLLFVHEDIKFQTKSWGLKLLEELEDKNVGVVGVAGSSYVPFAPCGFYNAVKKYNFYNLIQHTGSGSKIQKKLPKNLYSLKALDGVFLGVRKDVWQNHQFNEKLPGFHSYDLDFTLKISKIKKNKISDKILIEHFSLGKPNKTFLKNNITVRKNITIQNENNDYFNEYSSYRMFLNSLNKFDFSRLQFIEEGLRFISFRRLGLKYYSKSVLSFLLSLFKTF